MGIVYDGPYRDLIGPHEGHVIACTPGGTRIGDAIWLAYEDTAHHLEARCAECGWMGTLQHPVSEAGEEAGHREWRDVHIQPLIDKAASSWRQWAAGVGSQLGYFAGVAQDGTAPRKWADVTRGLAAIKRDIADRLLIAEELAEEERE